VAAMGVAAMASVAAMGVAAMASAAAMEGAAMAGTVLMSHQLQHQLHLLHLLQLLRYMLIDECNGKDPVEKKAICTG